MFAKPPEVSDLEQVVRQLLPPFYRDWGFWLSFVIGLAGLVFSILAWVEAKRAKRAATVAGRTVKLQTIAIELTEIIQKLERVQPGIRFSEARDLISETSRRVHRVTSPFVKEVKLSDAIESSKLAIEGARASLGKVRPTESDAEGEAPNAVYYGIENDCTAVTNAVSDLLGLFEKQAFDFGDNSDGRE